MFNRTIELGVDWLTVAALRQSGAILLDVRDRSAWVRGHVPGSMNCPLELLTEADLERTRPLVAVCLCGDSSAIAAKRLHAAGFENVCHLDGGLIAWIAANQPLVSCGGNRGELA